MFCPQCGSTQSEELKFCKACGVNLVAVRTAVKDPKSVEKFNWNKSWVSEMMMGSEESVKRAAKLERLQGITPATKRLKNRLNEIKGGIITASVGIGLMITLYVLMRAIIQNPAIPPETAILLSSIWVAGVIPLLVGISLIINGVFISKKLVDAKLNTIDERTKELDDKEMASFLPPHVDTNQLEREVFSVTDETTRHLDEPVKVKRSTN